MNYAIRITRPYKDLSPFTDYLKDCCDKVVVYEHEADRRHVHGLLIQCKVATDTLKYNIKKVLNVSSFPKTDWSFKTEHKGGAIDDNFIIYMAKGKLDPVFVHGYSDAELYEYRSKWVEQPYTSKGFVQYKLISEKPATQKQRLNQLLEPVINAYHKHEIRHPREVVNMICQIIRREKLIVGRYKIRDYYDYVMNQVNESEWNDQIFSLCIKT